MSTVFIGGSRHISRLPNQVKDRLENIIASGHQVLVGDANGADKAVQKYFKDASYPKVVVYCSGDHCRNNLGAWTTHLVKPPRNSKGFQFYAAKDREMAREADFGLMIWDGESAGTALNVLRLVRADKKAVLIDVPTKQATSFKARDDWDAFLAHCSATLRASLRERATTEEWNGERQQSLLDIPLHGEHSAAAIVEQGTDQDPVRFLNEALIKGDIPSVIDLLGNIAKARGMSLLSKETGLARESLYRALGPGGNPEFATVLKVIASLGLRLEAKAIREERHERGTTQRD